MARFILNKNAKFLLDENLDLIYKNLYRNPVYTGQFAGNLSKKNDQAPDENEEQDNDQPASSGLEAMESELQKEDDLYSHGAMENKYVFLDLNKESLLKGIILSEILGKPRAKRRFGR
ncbi:MAG TPA: hypothetical protein GXX14_13280 [Clostridiaceae bacterium]|nr:hypothetical protein [Clostridiaceae bacterium]